MTYDKEFEEMLNRVLGVCTTDEKKMAYFGWTEARKDHYRIGEEVEIRFSPDDEYEPATICARSRAKTGGYLSYTPSNVRRIPPKSRIDEIAEEAEDRYRRGAVGAGSLTDIIKSAILKDREEREANR